MILGHYYNALNSLNNRKQFLTICVKSFQSVAKFKVHQVQQCLLLVLVKPAAQKFVATIPMIETILITTSKQQMKYGYLLHAKYFISVPLTHKYCDAHWLFRQRSNLLELDS